MTCKDCTHCDVCRYKYQQIPLCDCTYDESENVEKIGCPFKNKSRLVELPGKNEIQTYSVGKTLQEDTETAEAQDVFDKIIEDIFRAVAPSFLKEWNREIGIWYAERGKGYDT